MYKLLLVIFGILLASVLVLGVIYIKSVRGVGSENIRFISNHKELKWAVNRDKLLEIEKAIINDIKDKEGPKTRVNIILSPEFKETADGSGYKELDPVYFSEWGVSAKKKVLNVYVDLNIWVQISKEERDRLLSNFITQRIIAGLNVNPDIIDLVLEKGSYLGLEQK